MRKRNTHHISEKIRKLKKSFFLTFRRFIQFIYITFSKYADTLLWESASACSFGFIFSFIPVVLIIITVLVTLLKFSPTVLNYILEFCERIEIYYDFLPLINSLINIKSITFIHIFLGIWVIWMARKLFQSIVQGIKQIFRSKSTRQAIFYQLFAFISEFVVVLLFTLIIIITFTFDKFIQIPIFDGLRSTLPAIFNKSAENTNRVITLITYFLFFLFTFYCYRFVSGTRPKVKVCLFYSAASTGTFFIVSFFLGKFINMNNYNVIYGTVSTLIVMLFRVYLFFIIFFFCAEMVYVSQFFDNLLIAQIYILPHANLIKSFRKFCNFLFENPRFVYAKTEVIKVFAGTIIYKPQETPKHIFYICNGIIKEYKDNIELIHNKGDFFGDLPPMLHKNYKTISIAKTDSEIMLIDIETFLETVRQNPKASTEALNKLNRYTGENKIL